MHRFATRARSLALGAGLACFVAVVSGQQPPQTPPRPVFRGAVDLIQIDVVVLDGDGRPVHGLTKEDFTLIDKGKPRDIATLAEQANHYPPETLMPANVPLASPTIKPPRPIDSSSSSSTTCISGVARRRRRRSFVRS